MAVYPTSYDPGLQAAPRGSLKSGLRSILGLYRQDPGLRATPEPQLQKQASSYVDAQTTPLVDALRKTIEGRAKAGSDTIGNYTQAWQDRLGGEDEKAAGFYDEAIQGAGNDQAALAQFLGREGQDAYKGLEAKIGEVGHGPEQLAIAADRTTGAAKGAAGAGLAGGNALLGRLRGNKAAGVAEAAAMPGIAGLAGARSLRLLQGQLNTELTGGTREILARAPGLAAQILDTLRGRELTKTGARQDFNTTRAGAAAGYADSFENRELQKAVGRQGFQTEAAEFTEGSERWDKEFGETVTSNRNQEEIERLRTSADEGADKLTLQSNAESAVSSLVTTFKKDTPRQRWHVDPDGPVRYGEDGKPVMKDGKAVGSNPGYYSETKPKGKNAKLVTRTDPQTGKPIIDETTLPFDQAYKRAFAHIAPILRKSTQFTDKEIGAIVRSQLAAYGITPKA